MLATKTEFADIVGKTAACVSQWIKNRKISGDALVGTGRNAKINVEKAQAQLRVRLDPGQRLGNGATTKLSKAKAATRPAKAAIERDAEAPEADQSETDDPGPSSLDYQAQRARLAKAQADAQEMKNAVGAGELVRRDDVQRRWNEALADVRSYILAVSGRLRDAVPELNSSQVGKIDGEIRRALKDAADGLSSRQT